MKNDLPIAPTSDEIARTLEESLALQRAAYFAHPVPTLAERKADLRTLQRFIRENKQALCDAISADYGHRSQHETLLAEIFPAGGPEAAAYDGPYSVDDLRVAVRVACEEGAHFIKTFYPGDSKSFAKVVAYSTLPVLVAGGPKAKNAEAVLTMVKGAMDGGGKGVVMGRKVWQSSNPPAMMRAMMGISLPFILSG